MSDVTDIPAPQYGAPAFGYGYSGNALDGSPSGGFADTELREHLEAPAYDPAAYQDFHNAGPKRSVFSDRPGDFLTTERVPARHFSQSRQIPAGGGIVVSATKHITGINLVEATGTGTAQVVIRRGTHAGEVPLLTYNLAANESVRDFIPLPLEARGGIFVQVVSGTITGAILTEEERNV